MKEGHIDFIIIKEDFNEYEIERGLFLRVKPIVVDLVTKGSESGFAVIFDLFSKVIRSTNESSNEVRYDETKQLQFKPLKEVINIYETQKTIILVVYQLEKILPTNEKDNESLPILGLTGDTLINVVEKPHRSVSGREKDTRDKDVFRNIFWARVCERHRNLSRNTTTTDFVFDIEGVRRPIQEGGLGIGLGIGGFDQPFVELMLREIQNEDGLVELIPDQGRFRLTPRGIEYCKKLPETHG